MFGKMSMLIYKSKYTCIKCSYCFTADYFHGQDYSVTWAWHWGLSYYDIVWVVWMCKVRAEIREILYLTRRMSGNYNLSVQYSVCLCLAAWSGGRDTHAPSSSSSLFWHVGVRPHPPPRALCRSCVGNHEYVFCI